MTITGNRLRIVTGRGIKIIDDSYNAAPESMKSAIVTLSNTDGNRRVAVLGDMNELGAGSEEEHFKCGKFAGDNQIDLLIAIGEKGRDIARGGEESEGIQVMYFENKEALYDKIDDIFKQGDVVLVKASRTLQLEELAERIGKQTDEYFPFDIDNTDKLRSISYLDIYRDSYAEEPSVQTVYKRRGTSVPSEKGRHSYYGRYCNYNKPDYSQPADCRCYR